MTIRAALRVTLSLFLGTAALAAAETTYLPGAAEVTGLAGARFSSTLEISNPGGSATVATIGLVPMSGKAAPSPVTRTLAAGESLRIPEALETLFGLSDGAAGTLTVTADEPLLANLSTLNVAAPEGAYGLGLLPVASSDLLGAGETGHSIWVSQSADPKSGYRTNLSVTLAEPGTVVEVRVLDAEGRVAGTATVTAATPEVWQQPAAALIGAGTDLPVGRVEFEVKAGRATAYAVVNDNVTSDAIALQSERVVPGPTDRLISGAALAPGHLGSFWSTDLRLFNPGSAAVDATVLAVGASREASVVVSVPAKGVVEASRVLALLEFPEGTACALRVTAGASLLVAARTNNVDPAGVRRGTFSAQQFVTAWPDGLLGAGSVGFFNGVDQTLNVPGTRTNLTIVGGPEGAAGELVLRDATGLEQARKAFSRGPGEWGQLGVADWFSSPAAAAAGLRGLAATTIPENARIDVSVASGALDAFVSRIDNGSGDAVTRPVTLPGGGDCSKVAITSFGAEPQPVLPGVPTTFSWTVAIDPPSAELTSQSIRFDGEAEIDLGKDARSYTRSFDSSGARSATLTVRKGSCLKTRSVSFSVCGNLALEPTVLPNGIAFAAYPSRQLTMPGAAGPVAFAVTAGALPEGLSLSPAGVLSGVPEEVGTFDVTMQGTDANGCKGSRTYTFSVLCAFLEISPSTLPDGTVGIPAAPVQMSVSGGSETGTWSATGLPPGLTLSPSGLLSGTPTTAGRFLVAVRFVDSIGCEGTASYTVVVCDTLVVTPGTVPAATAGTPYGPFGFAVAGATGAPTWAVTAGALPAGLALDPGTGALSGTPTVVGTFPFTVTATDGLGCNGSVAVSLVVSCPSITVNPASLANGTAGVAYGPVGLTQAGGLGAVTWAVTAGALPAGMTLGADGVLSGTPTVTGTFPFTVTVTDTNGCTGSRAYSLTIDCPVIGLSPASLGNGTAGVAYGPVALTQTGGVGAVTFAVTAGALPAGLDLSAAGVLSGTPTVVGPFGFTVTATDANGCTGTRVYSLVVDCPVIIVNPASVADGTAGVAYPGAAFTQAGGVGTITWSVFAGVLPTGMSLDAATGLLSGTPLQTGAFPITVRATDANGCFGERALTLTVLCPTIVVNPASVPNGTAGVVYPGATFTQTGGVGAVTWSLFAGILPNGMSLDAATGLLSGTPLQTGAFPITVRATDANGCVGDRALTLTILCPTIVPSPSAPLGGVEGSAFGPITFSQTGGVGAVLWSSTGTLPAGLTFSAAGVLSGTPEPGSAGEYTVTFTATDQNLCAGSVQITFRICPVVTVGPTPLAAFLQGQPYADTLAGAGGAAPYTFAVTAGALPAGVLLDGTTGALSGIPTTLEVFDFTITATDANGCTGSRTYTGRVCPVITVTTNLPNGVVGVAYSQALAASGSPDLPYTFSLTGGALPDGVNLVAGVLTGTPTTSGTFLFTITATDTNGCTGSRVYTVEVCVAPTITPTPTAVCAASTGNTAEGPAGATTYLWTIANGTITAGASAQTVTYTAGASGNVTLTLTVTSASSCTASTSVDVPINANPATPTITGVPPGGVCADSTGNTASGPAGATTYAWTITGGTITSAANLQTVTYTAGPSGNVQLTLVVTNASGCSASNSTTAAINANPATPTITGVPAGGVCADSTGNTASGPAGATTYAWTIAGGTITSGASAQTVTYTAGATGNVQLTLVVTNASGCSASNSTTAAINANPATPAITGVPAGGVCADSTGNTASGPAGATTYAWTIAGGTITSGASAQTVTYTAGAAGNVQLTLTVTNASGCSASSSTTAAINANPATPTITGVPPGGVCADSTGNTASGPAGATTYAWTITGGTITSAANLQTVTYTAGPSGNVQLTLVVTNASGCSASNSTTAAINANPATPTITGVPPGGVCADSTGNTASGPAGATTYAWTITGGTITSAANIQTVTYTAGASGSVNLTLVVTNASGCSASGNATAAINANPATPTITPAASAVCTLSTGNTASGPAGATTYLWGITNGTITGGGSTQTVTYTAGASGNVQLTLEVTNASGCSATSSVSVPIDPLPTLDPATGTGFTGTFGTAFSQAFTASGGTGPFTYTINPSTPPAGLSFVGGTLSGPPNATGTFTFTVTATSAVGCASTTQSYTLVVRPNLANDSYSGVGNTQLYITGVAGTPATPAVASATTALANDLPAAGVTVTGVVSPCVGLGGTITIDSAGRFVYTPPVGVTGNDACTYTATSDTGGTGTPASATATITIGLANRVWYVNGAAGAGDGRSHSPFNTLASASTAHASNDTVFVQSGGTATATPGAITMKATTWLWGQGTALPLVGGIAVQNTGATTKPSLTGTVTLGGSSVTVSSLDITTSGATGFTDDQAAAITGITVQNNVTVTANAAAVDLTSVSASASGIVFSSLTSTNSAGKGLNLTGIGGSFTSGATTVTNPAGIGIDVQTSLAGGTISLGPTSATASGGTGVNLASNAGNVTFGALTVTPDANQRGLLATENAGTLTVPSGTVTTTGATAVEITRSAGATPLSVSLTTVNANGGSNGIYLRRTSGSFAVVGSGTAGSGGTIQSMTGADGAVAGSGVYLDNATNVSLSRMQLNGFQNFAIRGLTVSGFTLANSVINGVNGNSAAAREGSVSFSELTGSASVSSTDISGGFVDNFRVVNTSGTLNRITFSSVTIGANSAADGNDGILLEALTGAAILNATIQNSTFTSARGDLFNFINNGTATCDLVFTGNTLTNNHPAIATGGGGVTISGGDLGGSLTYSISGNTFRDSDGTAVLIVKSTGAGTYSGSFANNQIGVSGVPNSGSKAGSGLKIQNAGLGAVTVSVTGNQIRQYNNFGIELLTGGGAAPTGGALNATITGNTIKEPGTGGLPMNGIHLNGGTVPGDTYQICASIGGVGALANDITGSGANVGTDFRLRQRQATTVRLPGYGGANNSDAAVVAFVQGNNGGASGLASNTVPTGGGFVGGAACPTP